MDLIRLYLSPGTGVNAVFYWVIAFIFWGGIAAELYQFLRRRQQLCDIEAKLPPPSADGANGSPERARRAEEILKGPETIEPTQKTETPVTCTAWTQFEPTLLRTDGKVLARESFHDYLTPDALPSVAWLTPRIVNAIPQWLTVLGILGTFIGLVEGLQGLKIQNTADLQSGIAQLVSGINTAYLTSIWGVTGSALFLFSDRWITDRTRRLTDSVAARVDRCFERITAESLLASLLEDQQEQTASIKSLNTDLSAAIRQALLAAVEAHLSPVMTTMSERVEEMTRRTGDEQARAMQEMASEFRRQMTSALSDGITSLTDAMERSSRELNAFSDQAGEMVGELRKVVGDLGQAGADLGNTISMMDDALESFASTMSLAEEHADRSEQLLKETQTQLHAFTARMTAQMEQMSAHSASFVEQFGEIAGRMDTISAEIREAAGGLESAQERSAGTLREISASVDQLDKRWKESSSHFEKVNRTLGDTAETFAEGMRGEVERYLSTLDQDLSKSMKSLGGVATSLEEGFESLQAAVSRWARVMEELLQRYDDLGDGDGAGQPKVKL